MRVKNLALQKPASAFSEGRWYLDTPLLKGLVGRAFDEDEPDAVDGHTREEVSNREEHQGCNVSQGCGPYFFPPSLPPQGGRKGTGEIIVFKQDL